MDVSIIIVNWNVKQLLIKCLQSIFNHTKNINFEVIVIDNASNDCSVAELRKLFSKEIISEKLLIIENDMNNGFAKANNQGLREARGRYVLFMNPDMEFIENTVEKMTALLDNNKNIGLATCQLLYSDRGLQRNIKRDPTFFSQFLIELKLHHLFKHLPCLKKYLAKDFDYSKMSQVEQVMGAFVFTHKSIITELNGWSEDYWMWWEDLDLCRRARAKGYEIWYYPGTSVIHHEGRSFAQVMNLEKQRRFVKGLLIYFKKFHSKVSYFILWIFSPISLVLAYLTQLLKIKPKTQSKL